MYIYIYIYACASIYVCAHSYTFTSHLHIVLPLQSATRLKPAVATAAKGLPLVRIPVTPPRTAVTADENVLRGTCWVLAPGVVALLLRLCVE